jgi:hypothetical protein
MVGAFKVPERVDVHEQVSFTALLLAMFHALGDRYPRPLLRDDVSEFAD